MTETQKNIKFVESERIVFVKREDFNLQQRVDASIHKCTKRETCAHAAKATGSRKTYRTRQDLNPPEEVPRSRGDHIASTDRERLEGHIEEVLASF